MKKELVWCEMRKECLIDCADKFPHAKTHDDFMCCTVNGAPANSVPYTPKKVAVKPTKQKTLVLITANQFKQACNPKGFEGCDNWENSFLSGCNIRPKCSLKNCSLWTKLKRIPADKITGEM